MLAVPLHGDDVAARFCSAERFMLAELERGRLAGEAEQLIDVFVRDGNPAMKVSSQSRKAQATSWHGAATPGRSARASRKEGSRTMPGYDRTGPVGAGPRTGRGLGRCQRAAGRARSGEDPRQGEGPGGNGRASGGGRGRGFGNGGRTRRRGFGIVCRASQDPAGSDVTPRRRQAFLRRRIGELTAQLDGVNQLLSNDAHGGVQDQE